MKKLFAILLIVAMVLSTFIASSVYVSADEDGKNYAESLKWTSGYAKSVKVDNGVTIVEGIAQAWSAPFLDILPALKQMAEDDGGDEIYVYLTFLVSAEFTEGNEDSVVRARPILRGVNNLSVPPSADTVEDWEEAYSEALDGETPVFYCDPGGNLLANCGEVNLELATAESDEDWYYFAADVAFTAAEINSGALKNWNFCFDCMTGVEDLSVIKNIKIKDLGIYISGEEPEPPATPTPEPTPEVEKTTPRPQANLQTPDLTGTIYDNSGSNAGVSASSTPAEGGASTTTTTTNNSNMPLIIGIAAGAVVLIAAAVVVIIVIKKKNGSKAE